MFAIMTIGAVLTVFFGSWLLVISSPARERLDARQARPVALLIGYHF